MATEFERTEVFVVTDENPVKGYPIDEARLFSRWKKKVLPNSIEKVISVCPTRTGTNGKHLHSLTVTLVFTEKAYAKEPIPRTK